jgi:hypothetical protein
MALDSLCTEAVGSNTVSLFCADKGLATGQCFPARDPMRCHTD